MTQLATITATNIQPIISLVCNAVTSDNTRRAYARGLTDFMAWHSSTNQTGFTKATVQAHVTALRVADVSASSINQRLTAIRKLAVELADNNIIDHSTAQAIARAEGVRTEGKRLGNWLTKEQAQTLIQLPDVTTSRDCAIGPSWPLCWGVACAVKNVQR